MNTPKIVVIRGDSCSLSTNPITFTDSSFKKPNVSPFKILPTNPEFDNQSKVSSEFRLFNQRYLPLGFKPLVLILLLLTVCFTSACPEVPASNSDEASRESAQESRPLCVDAYEAKEHVRSDTCVIGNVASVSYWPDVNRRPTFINLEASFPRQVFTVVVWGEDREKLSNIINELDGVRLEVHGTIGKYRGVPQIVVTDPSQIRISGEGRTKIDPSEQDQQKQAERTIKGNRRSKIYHVSGCPNYDQIAPRNIVWFKTPEAASAAGYRMARNCSFKIEGPRN